MSFNSNAENNKLTVSFTFLLSGASACAELHRFEEAITWCDNGLAVSFDKMLSTVGQKVKRKFCFDFVRLTMGRPLPLGTSYFIGS